jgi:signal transduction protein with GAF and PtsI domain
MTFWRGVGLPGRVWESASPAWIPDVVADTNFPRAPIAAREGLHAAFGFPILLRGQVFGVLEFFSREIREPDEHLLPMLTSRSTDWCDADEERRDADVRGSPRIRSINETRISADRESDRHTSANAVTRVAPRVARQEES